MPKKITPAEQVERHDCPKCQAPAGSPCRTGAGKVAAGYHTGRFALVPASKAELTVKTPADRQPGKACTQGAPVAQAPEGKPGAAIRLGCARCSTVGQELQSPLDALAGAQCTRVFSEEISTRVKERPELEKALALARESQAGRTRASRHPHRGRDEAPCPQRGGVDVPVRHPPSRWHPT
ncbi:zinc finger domain-containing protein [Streptomyces sp. NPDC001889]